MEFGVPRKYGTPFFSRYKYCFQYTAIAGIMESDIWGYKKINFFLVWGWHEQERAIRIFHYWSRWQRSFMCRSRNCYPEMPYRMRMYLRTCCAPCFMYVRSVEMSFTVWARRFLRIACRSSGDIRKEMPRRDFGWMACGASISTVTATGCFSPIR